MIDNETKLEETGQMAQTHPEQPPVVEPQPLPAAEEAVYPEEIPAPAQQAWVEPQPQPAPPPAPPVLPLQQPVVYPYQQPVYAVAQPQAPYPAPPQPYAPVYQQPVYYVSPPQPQKKKLPVSLKVFIWVASILVALSFLGFGGYLTYRAIENHAFSSNGNHSIPLPGGGDYQIPSPNIPKTPDDGDDTPDFDEDVVPPDATDPLPDVDVTPNHEGLQISGRPQGSALSVKDAYKKVVKSTVTVAVSLEQNGAERTGTGTGIIATSDGYIITNAHVVMNSKSSRVKITTYDGEEYDAVVVGMDRTTDLAVLKTNDHDFTPAEFGDTDELEIGDEVIAIGNPGGAKFSGSMTAGYVSGLDRAVGKYSESGMTYLQTDAAINPGNSGGPLVNMYGQVVAINSSKIVADGYEGMAFAIPVSKAQPIINELLSGGYVKGRVRLGITGQNMTGNFYGITPIPGFLIVAIDEDSAFQGTDAQVGDIITAVDGEEIASLDEMSNLLLKYAPGDEVTITLNRNGKEFDVKITLLEDKGETQK